MNILYAIVHKEDAKWMIGEKLDGSTNHPIKFKLYHLVNVREAVQDLPQMVALKVNSEGKFEAFNPFIPA